MDNFIRWVEEHPYAAAAIGLGLLVLILWLLGYFSSSSASANQGQTNMAAAYYAAEAAQAQAGAAIQSNQILANRDVAVATVNANAATAIDASNNSRDISNNIWNNTTAMTLGNDAYLTTQNNNYWANQNNQNNNYWAYQDTLAGNNTAAFTDFLNNIVPAEIAAGKTNVGGNVGGQNFNVSSGYTTTTPAILAAEGYTPAQISAIFG